MAAQTAADGPGTNDPADEAGTDAANHASSKVTGESKEAELGPHWHEIPPIRLSRVVKDVHTDDPFQLTTGNAFLHEETVPVPMGLPGSPRHAVVRYLMARVPLDCINDFDRADDYNPRKPKKDHRDNLMEQIGHFGLIQPLVTTLDNVNGEAKLFLIDGRHRYHSLLELDNELKQAIIAKHEARMADGTVKPLSSTEDLKNSPRPSASSSIKGYMPEREKEGWAPLIPVKIYLDQDQVTRIGMAVFLNKRTRRLHVGEEIGKLWAALENALHEQAKDIPEEDREDAADVFNEKQAVDRVAGNMERDRSLVVLSRHVAEIMGDSQSPWHDVLGKYQNDVLQKLEPASEEYLRDLEKTDSMISVLRKRPLTANNFVSFLRHLIDSEPIDGLPDYQRRLEIDNLNKLGAAFAKAFDWPEDIPISSTKDKHLKARSPRHTATSVLCRSFLIDAVGEALNEAVVGTNHYLLSLPSTSVEEDEGRWNLVWAKLSVLQTELAKQATAREEFDKAKKALSNDSSDPGSKTRIALNTAVDEARKKLWSMETIRPTLLEKLRREFTEDNELGEEG